MSKKDPGDNGADQLTEREREALLFSHARKIAGLNAQKKQISEQISSVKAMAKSHGFKIQSEVNFAVRFLTTEDESIMEKEVISQIKICQYWGTPAFSGQGDLFEDLKDRRPVQERAFAHGRKDGLAGVPNANPHEKGLVGHEDYEQGYADAQKQMQDELFDAMEKANRIEAGKKKARGEVPLEQEDLAAAGPDPDQTTGEAGQNMEPPAPEEAPAPEETKEPEPA